MVSGMTTGAQLDGMKAGNKPCDNSASALSLGSFRPKRFEWAKMNLDTGAAVNFGSDGAGDGRFHRTASGECIPDGGAHKCQGYDEHGLCRSLNGGLTGVHKVLCSAGEIACKRHIKISVWDHTVVS